MTNSDEGAIPGAQDQPRRSRRAAREQEAAQARAASTGRTRTRERARAHDAHSGDPRTPHTGRKGAWRALIARSRTLMSERGDAAPHGATENGAAPTHHTSTQPAPHPRPERPLATRELVVAAIALLATLAAVVAGVVGVAFTLGGPTIENEATTLGSAMVGAFFVGTLLGLMPGCIALMLVITSSLLGLRQKVVLCLMPPLVTAVLATVPTLILGVASRTALTWAVWPVGLLAVAGTGWLLWQTWTSLRAAPPAEADLREDDERRTLVPGLLPFDPHSQDPGVQAYGGFATDVREEEIELAPGQTPPRGPWVTLREHAVTPRVGAALTVGAVIVLVACALSLVRSASYLPQQLEVLTTTLPPWYTTASGAFAAAFLWGPLWLAGAGLLALSRRASRPERRLAWAFAPLLALALAVPLALGWLLAAVGLSGWGVRAAVMLLVLTVVVAAIVWVVQSAPIGWGRLKNFLLARDETDQEDEFDEFLRGLR